MGFRVLGFRALGSGFWGLGFRVLGFRALGFKVQGLGLIFGVQGIEGLSCPRRHESRAVLSIKTDTATTKPPS